VNHFPDRLHLIDAGMRDGSRVFSLGERFRYVSSYGIIEAPQKTLTDGASVPKMFRGIFEPFGEFFPAAVIHDHLYSAQNTRFTRAKSDLIFREAMYNLGIPWTTRETIYMAVRIFGASSFKAAI
jgi:hypothetical protein